MPITFYCQPQGFGNWGIGLDNSDPKIHLAILIKRFYWLCQERGNKTIYILDLKMVFASYLLVVAYMILLSVPVPIRPIISLDWDWNSCTGTRA